MIEAHGAQAPVKMGRFELRGELGRGAQARVWLAHDTRLEREVALKVLNANSSSVDIDQWLNEARAVAGLSHPGIVPVFEADRAGDQPFMVFELVRGETLSQRIRRSGGGMPEREAAQLMVEVLDALSFAHDRGIVHRDLKPSNVLIGEDGRARVMDFGIAARINGGGDGRVVGTPGYISPEAARGEPPAPTMDVFAAGMMLGHMLSGVPLILEADPMRALERVRNQQVQWPERSTASVSDALRDCVLRAVARDAVQRYPSAAAFRDALSAWLNPVTIPLPEGARGTLEFLLRRMRHKSDFPALGDAVIRIQKRTQREDVRLAALAEEILKDVALSQKLLRMVNTVHFMPAGGGNINTVSRAVAVVGMTGVRSMALSLLLLEHMKDKQHAQTLREMFLQALFTGALTDELTPPTREREESFVAGMLSQLGPLLVAYYLPEESEQIRSRLQSRLQRRNGEIDRDIEEARIVNEVLGMSMDELGAGVAKAWGLPDSLQKAISPIEGPPPSRAPVDALERLRWRVGAARQVARTMLGLTSGGASLEDPEMEALVERYVPVLNLRGSDMLGAVSRACEHVDEIARTLHIELGKDNPARRLLGQEPGMTWVPASGIKPLDAAEEATLILSPSLQAQHAHEMLSAGIAQVTEKLASESFRLNELLGLILDTIRNALQFERVVFCLRDTRSGQLVGRLSRGEDADRLCSSFRVDVQRQPPADLFALSCLKGADTLIADTAAIAKRLPGWYAPMMARSFLLLPLTLRQAPLGLIYVDRNSIDPMQVPERELNLLRTLRNQAVMAFKSAA